MQELRLSPLAEEGLKMAPLDEESTTVGGGRGSGRGGESELGPEAMVRADYTHTVGTC